MSSQAQPLISLFRATVLAGATALLIASAALPMPAQNSVPATAVQAAKTPQFASRLAHPARRPASRPNPALARQRSRSGPPQNGDIYDNGPINGTTDAWTINSGFVVSDTMTIAIGGNSVGDMNFGAWLFPGDVIESVQISITSEPNGGTTYFNGVVNFTQSGCSGNQYGFNVCTESSGNFSGPNLAAGTYWVNLQNAVVNTGDPVYWDENSGVGCDSQGCPSQASETGVGTIPSESFTVLGGNTTTCQPPFCHPCFGPGGSLQVLYNFTQQEAGQNGPNGVTIDRAGNLYGTNPNGGENNAGFAYKLARFAGWLLDPLFSFFGGNNGGPVNGAILGPNGTLYGGAQGGIQNCNSEGTQYCGLVYNLTPPPTACLTSQCSWIENVLYRFSSESDGAGFVVVSASDQEGNLYGVTTFGGTYDAGTVFELTPSAGGWTKNTLYSFTGGDDGGFPGQVLVGNDGNLYGVANGNVTEIVFQLTPSGGQWTESVLHNFGGGITVGNLVQDGAGNLYGSVVNPFGPNGLIFVLEKIGSGWVFSDYAVHHGGMYQYDLLNNLTIDADGKLYGTGSSNYIDEGGISGYIFQAWYAGDGWHYQDLDFLSNQNFPVAGSLALDSSGNLYGTTGECTDNNGTSYGTVWRFSP